MSIDLFRRMDYADVFDFDKFHEAFKQQLAAAKGGERFTLRDFIEDRHEIWHDYDVSKSVYIAEVLELEVSELYGLSPDPEDYYLLPKAIKQEEKKREPSFRELAKEYLENQPTPQDLDVILEYVNANSSKKTTLNSLYSSLYLADKVFIHFIEEDKWGLLSIDYTKQKRSRKVVRYNDDNQEGLLGIKEDEPVYNIRRTNLASQKFELRYSTRREHKPTDFFNKALSNSSRLDLGLGYFSSACFNVLASGFAHFVKNGGKMRLYINPNVSEEDYNLLRNSDRGEFEQYMINSYNELRKIFSRRDELFFRCLAYLIRNQRIEVKIVLLKEDGIAHEKFGVFTDTEGNEVAFNGSMNLTAHGLTKNIDTIDAVCSWRSFDDKKRIRCYHDDFKCIWDCEDPDILVYPAEDFCKHIVTEYPSDDVDELVILEKDVVREILTENYMANQEEPHFPQKFKDGPRKYQTDAYDEWKKRGKQGIFAMATGTGKTITALNCALEEYREDGFYRLLILVPSLALVEQWGDEVRNFNYRNVIKVSSENATWKQDLAKMTMKMGFGRNVNYVIIATYQSFVMTDFQVLLPRLSRGAILIADEAHNIGSNSVREAFRNLAITRRIALSATPNRVYDEEGTREIECFFHDTYPYTYSFSMRRAIQEERLMPYFYFPYPVKLEEDEMEEYANITHQLVQLYNNKDGFSDPERARKLLLIRKNILHKAKNKMMVFKNIIQDIGENKLRYCFVYSAAGKRSRSDECDDEQLDEYILQEMQKVLKETFPNVTCNSYTGEDSKVARKQKLTAFADGLLNVLFAKNCLDEGVDVPRAEYGIFTSSTGNPRQFVQRRGRLLRRHDDKQFAFIFDMVVVPNFYSPYYDRSFWRMEKNMVENEMRRVANFGSMASNYYSGALNVLDEILSFYEIDLDGMVLNEEQ